VKSEQADLQSQGAGMVAAVKRLLRNESGKADRMR
jgi:hypothetical protein